MDNQPPQLKFSESISKNEPIELSDNEYVILLKPIPSPSLFLQVKTALSKNLLNNEVFMKLCIHSASDERHLALMGLILRQNFDPNTYYKTKENQIHVIPYIYMVLYNREPEICHKAARLFITSGSDITKNALSQDNISVKDWIDKKYPNSLTNLNLNLSENPDEKKLYSVFLDRPDLLKGLNERNDQFLFSKAIIFHADTIFQINLNLSENFSFNKTHNSDSSEDHPGSNENKSFDPLKKRKLRVIIDSLVDMCVKYLNVKCIRYFLENKYIPSYVLINNVIVYLKYYKQKNYFHGLSVMKEILDMLFEFGSKIDSFQADMIRTLDIDDNWFNSSTNLKSIGNKENLLLKCTNSQSPEGMCSDNNQNLWKIHHKINSEISRTLNRNNIDADLNTNSYITNPMELDKNKFDEELDRCLDILIHCDENGAKWYISSGVFDSVRERGINPYTGKIISHDEMSVLSQKRSTIKRFGLLTSLRCSDVDDLITDKKSIIDNNTNQIISAFGKLCRLNNIREDQVDMIPIKYLQRILDEFSDRYLMPSSELKYLNHNHGIATFKRIVMTTIRFSPQDSSIIFGYIKLAISRKNK